MMARDAAQTWQINKIQVFQNKNIGFVNNSRKLPVANLGTPLERLALKSDHPRWCQKLGAWIPAQVPSFKRN